MHRPGDQLFSGSTLAVDQDRALGGSHGADGLLELFHRRAHADDVVQRIAGGGIALERKILPA